MSDPMRHHFGGGEDDGLAELEGRTQLMPCKACGKPIWKKARTCPHCGRVYTTGSGVFIAIVIGLLIAGGLTVKIRG